jgi:hypothetical protein
VLAAYAHGAHLVLLDGIGLGVGLSAEVGVPAALPDGCTQPALHSCGQDCFQCGGQKLIARPQPAFL